MISNLLTDNALRHFFANVPEERKNDWRRIGNLLGYPKCCIEAFCNMEHVGMRDKRPLHGTGYVPCLMCAATYTDEELIAKIDAARHPSIKAFPNGRPDEVIAANRPRT